jgi:UDP-N-acetylglucosamine acyltransferase
MAVHPTAVLHPSLVLPADAEIGPYAVLDEGVRLGIGVRIGPFCHLHTGSVLDDRVSLSDGVVVGGMPQDLKYRGESTGVHIGSGTQLREYVTVNRGTAAAGTTLIGRDCLLMAYTHVGHDSDIGDRCVIANAVQLGGHVQIGEAAIVSGITGVHQFVSIGPGAFVGGGLRAIKDVLPFTKGLGDPMRYGGPNPMGLERLGFPPVAESWLRAAYKALFSGGPTALEDWVADARERSRMGGEGDLGRLADILGGWMARRTRSILLREGREG